MSSGMGMDELVGDTLALVNAARGAFGKEMLNELPDARRGATGDCLFYRALADVGVTRVGTDTMQFQDDRTADFLSRLWGADKIGPGKLRSPQQFQEVINAFDTNGLDFYALGATDNGE